MLNNFYESCHDKIFRQARELAERWAAAHPEAAEKQARFPSPIRPYQWNWMDSPKNEPPHNCVPKVPPCPICGGVGAFTSERNVEGCRMNGDAWGTTYEWCPVCGYCTYWKWDEY